MHEVPFFVTFFVDLVGCWSDDEGAGEVRKPNENEGFRDG